MGRRRRGAGTSQVSFLGIKIDGFVVVDGNNLLGEILRRHKGCLDRKYDLSKPKDRLEACYCVLKIVMCSQNRRFCGEGILIVFDAIDDCFHKKEVFAGVPVIMVVLAKGRADGIIKQCNDCYVVTEDKILRDVADKRRGVTVCLPKQFLKRYIRPKARGKYKS